VRENKKFCHVRAKYSKRKMNNLKIEKKYLKEARYSDLF
jgi:hypothetical protein